MANEKTHIPGFLTKTFEIFSSAEYSDSCGWGANGDTIVIRKIEQFSKQVLPNYFKHSNFQSFVRQLNMYDFRKTVQDPNHGEFLHQHFRKGHPELLKLIKRKASSKHLVEHGGSNEQGTKKSIKAAKQQAAQVAASSGFEGLNNISSHVFADNDELQSNLLRLDSNASDASWTGLIDHSLGGTNQANSSDLMFAPQYSGAELVRMNSLGSMESSAFPSLTHVSFNEKEQMVSETGALLAELHEQRVSREQYEKSIESRLGQVETENHLLKTLFIESHHKNLMMQDRMDKLMRSIYSLFMGGPGVNKQQLLSDITSSMNGANKLLIEGSGSSSGREIVRNLQSVGDMSNYDITNLRRLPSLDLSGLSQPSAELYNNLVSAAQEGSNNLVRMSSKDGMELSRQGNSFEYAASFVTAPTSSMRYLPSFDATYLDNNIVHVGQPSSVPADNTSSSTSSYPMSDRVTLLSETSQEGSQDEAGAAKKRRLELSPCDAPLGPPLEEGDVSAAKEFIEQLNKNQEVTLQRLDSLEMTISTLLDDKTNN